MVGTTITQEHLNYIQRSDVRLADPHTDGPTSKASDLSRQLWHIRGIGKLDSKVAHPGDKQIRSTSEDLIIGLYGHGTPMAFSVRGSKYGVDIGWGTWRKDLGAADESDSSGYQQKVLKASLNAMYPDIVLDPVRHSGFGLSRVGFSLGIPTVIPADIADGSLPLDRLIRAMVDTNWAILVLADPVDEAAIGQLRGNIIEESRSIQSAVETKSAPAPLAKHYEELLSMYLSNMTMGVTVGSWRVGVYLLGDDFSFSQLKSLWRGLFTGEKSLPEPIRCWDYPLASSWADDWILPDVPATPGPGFFRHPLAFQTILNSQQLAAFCHLPKIETPGFTISTVPDFDTNPNEINNTETIALGNIQKHRKPVQQSYEIELDKLTKHIFIAGVTGAGKSNTIFYILKEIYKKGIPFLVIEPAKTEYRALLNESSLKGKLQVFTCGDEEISPFRINPFEVISGTNVSVHIDLLRSVFSASFGLWTPLPQILEQCLHEIYIDRGWNILNNKNSRLDKFADPCLAFPTLTDLANKVDQVIKSLGYDERIASDMRASLLTRINSLRTGGKGRLFDVQKSIPMASLLSHPTILELDAIGDDDDKAFLMGLIFIQLVSHRRQQGQVNGIQHMLVFEEAHRLLTNVGSGGKQDEANPRGKAVESFSNLLSEIRAYGQSILVADQVPVKLAPDVIKNTNLKIIHRLVASDDRTILAGSMAMKEHQAKSLSTLSTGEAVLFSEGDDAPILVKISHAKMKTSSISNSQVAKEMNSNSAFSDAISSGKPGCSKMCIKAPDLCTIAQDIVGETGFYRALSRMILSTIVDSSAVDRLWPDLYAYVQLNRNSRINEKDLWLCISSHAAERYVQINSAKGGWSYTHTDRINETLECVLIKKYATGDANLESELLRQQLLSLNIRIFDPFPCCSNICNEDHSELCLYRNHVVDLIESGRFTNAWTLAMEADKNRNGRNEIWGASMDAGFELMEFAAEDWPKEKRVHNHQAANCTSLCFAQQMLFRSDEMSPQNVERVINALIKEARHE